MPYPQETPSLSDPKGFQALLKLWRWSLGDCLRDPVWLCMSWENVTLACLVASCETRALKVEDACRLKP